MKQDSYTLADLLIRLTGSETVDSACKQIQVHKVIFDRKKHLIKMKLLTTQPFSLKHIENVLEEVQKYLGLKDKVETVFTTDTLIEDIEVLRSAEFLEENLRYILSSNFPAGGFIKESIDWQLSEEGTLQLQISDPLICKKANDRRLNEEVSRMISSVYGCTLRCTIVQTEEAEFDENLYREKQAARENAMFNDLISTQVMKTGDAASTAKKKPARQNQNGSVWVGKTFSGATKPIGSLTEEDTQVILKGDIFDVDIRVLKNGRKLFVMDITDYTGSVTAKIFESPKQKLELDELLKPGVAVLIRGSMQYDHFNHEQVLMVSDLMPQNRFLILDEAIHKRIEFHCHTNMSQMDGLSPVEKLVKQAAEWGHEAVAVTDHGVVQAFPEAAEAGKKYGIRIIYGMEGYLVDDEAEIVNTETPVTFDDPFVVFDIETTGLSNAHDRITEIGAVRIEKGEIVDEYTTLVNPGMPIPPEITQLTGITDEMVANAPEIAKVLPTFNRFCEGAVLVAHNAEFDVGFIRENMRKLEYDFTYTILDTLSLSRILLKNLKRHKLNQVAKALHIKLENHHRAVHDAKATAEIFLKLVGMLAEKGIHNLEQLNCQLGKEVEVSRLKPYHVVLIAKNMVGLRHLYELVSASHMNHFHKKPLIPKSLLRRLRDGLLVGNACQAGELFQALLHREPEEKIESIARFYDYLEIQPTGNNAFLIEKGMVQDQEELKNLNRRIIVLGEKLKLPVIATGDSHYASRTDDLYRQVLQAGMGYEDTEDSADLHFRTTTEMLHEFAYLGEDKAKEIVIENPAALLSHIDSLKPVPDGTFPPYIAGSEEQLEKLCYDNAIRMYGDPLPELVEKRLNRELRSIIDNGYAVMYMIAHKLVAKSLEDGYLVGSRGSVGSSLAATMSGITEVNPLPPHYVCPSCRHSQFFTEGEVESGIDLPDKNCTQCHTPYIKEGHQIPFEVFLGFEGDKEPDIDLNFAGEYQAQAHQYIEQLFGASNVYRAGTIGTIASKTAYGFVKKYGEEKGLHQNNAEIKRLTEGCSGVKRTTGQHPGGVMIVPADRDIHEFTPIQYPANDSRSGIVTTHFDYHALSGRLLKLDILGHDVPTMIRMLEDFTGTKANELPLDDATTKTLFVNALALNVKDESFKPELGSIAIPEFGTRFVRQMLKETQPSTFGELVRISGLSHGTDVWINNAQDLVRNNTATLKEVICTRDDIMNYLILKGMPSKDAFKIMENVRKGKGVSDEESALMASHQVPQWYIDSCNKIKYMFPKAHAVAYVMMSFRIAWYKVHHPEAFYATYFSMKVDDFDAQLMIQGPEAVKAFIREIEDSNQMTAKEKNQLTVLEVALEMFSRGIEMLPVDLYASDPDHFLIEKKKIRPPLSALQGVGQNAARKIAEERLKSQFLSMEDLHNRTSASKVVIETLHNHGACHNLPETNQLTLFQLDLNA